MTQTFSKQTILVVDDFPDNIDLVMGILKEAYEIKAATNGIQALKIANGDPQPDLILLDVSMPDMDGLEVCRRLKADPNTSQIPVIFVTARNAIKEEAIGLQLGAVDYITKPFSPAILKARIRTHLALYDQNRALEQMVRQRTQELEHERSQFSWVVQNAEVGYLLVDQNESLLYINPKAEFYLNIAPEIQASPKSKFNELVLSQYRIEPESVCKFDEQPTRYYFIRPETKTARAFWLKADIHPMSLAATPTWMIRLEDVSEKIDEGRNIQSFSAMIQHKLRTPLSAMIPTIHMLVDYAPDLTKAEITEFSEIAKTSLKRLQETIDDILHYLSASEQVITKEGLQVSEFTAIINDLSASLDIEKCNVKLETKTPDAILSLSTRATELILWEILENSKKFHPKNDPTIDVKISEISDGMIDIIFQDDGIHLSPDQLVSLWNPFFQGDKHFTGEMPGMGLGLSLVASIIWEIGGNYQAYNRKDQAGFILELSIPTIQ